MLPTRELAWDGCLNVRDLGGLPTEDGGETRFGAVVRADSVRQLSDAGWEALAAYGVGRIVDLRWHDELAEDPPRALDLDVVHVPVFPDPDDPAWHEIESGDRTREYIALLEWGRECFARAVAEVARGPGGPVVVHCTAGRDRTGLVAALVLRLAGVAPETIAADYALSDRNLESATREWIEAAGDDAERARRAYLRSPAAMDRVLAAVESRHGSVAGYLRAGGSRGEELDAVRARLRG